VIRRAGCEIAKTGRAIGTIFRDNA
jgi:hypothetical protein